MKEEAHDFLEQDTVRELIKKYSQFINFNIYLWGSKTEEVEEPIEEEEEEAEAEKKEEVRKFLEHLCSSKFGMKSAEVGCG